MEDNPIHTKDLSLYTVLSSEYELLEADYAHPKLWLDRGFSDPYKYFLNNRNPIPYRINQVRKNPEVAKYLLRVAVLKQNMVVVGSAGFHNLPDENGMIEIGFGVDPAFQNKKLEFKLVGEQMDDIDGVEEIYELSANDYKLRFTDISS